MSTYEQFLGIIHKLIAKSHKNEVNWNVHEGYETALTVKPRRIQMFSVIFQDGSTIQESYHVPDGGMDFVQVKLFRQQREIYSIMIEDTQENFELLYELYQSADRSVNKWAESMSAIEQELSQNGVVGQAVIN